MSTIQIIEMCREISRNYVGRESRYDADILNIIISLYNRVSEIDWEEVRWLWVRYMETGNLYFSDAITMAKNRINGKGV